MNEEWLSAHLDGELTPSEERDLAAALDADAALRAELAELANVRRVLRDAVVALPPGTQRRIVDAVAAEGDGAAPGPVGRVAPLRTRRRVPGFAAVAAALVIIASVVGGVGGTASVPALGELVARHQAAAVESDEFMASVEEMPMDDAMAVGPPMPTDYSMLHAFREGRTVQLVYRTGAGEMVSVFREDGDVDLHDLPGGEMSSAGPRPMWSSTRGASHVVVVDGVGYVWVIVSAEPHESMMVAMMDDLPSRRPGILARARDAADAAVGAFRFWE